MKKTKLFTVCCILFAVLLGGFFRFYNLDWDRGQMFHPDERNVAAAVSRLRFFSQLNPHFFAYGSLPIYLYRAVGDFLVWLEKNQEWVYHWGHIDLIGRFFSALFSTLTIFLVYRLGKKVFAPGVGLLAAFFCALAVGLIQTAHYAVTESYLAFFVVLLTLLSFSFYQNPSSKTVAILGAVAGLALSSKMAALSFLVIPGFAFLFVAHQKPSFWPKLKTLFSYFFLFFLFSVFFFLLTSPYVFLDYKHFRESMVYESGVATGSLSVPYTLQFDKTIPYLFQIKNLFWTLGPFLAPLGVLGALYLLLLAFRNWRLFLLIVFPFVYFAITGWWHTKFLRYMVPLLPFLALFAAKFLLDLKKLFLPSKLLLITYYSLLGFTLVGTLTWSLAFLSIYQKEFTRILASKWIYQNIPPGAKIYTEHWDDGLPLELPPHHPSQYQSEQLTIYEPDNQQKLNYFATKLAQGDYLVLCTRRLWGTLIHRQDKYPLTSKYYKMLFNGSLDYTMVAKFSSSPRFFRWEINDDGAEETFQVYDHPTVLIFKNNHRLNSGDYQNLLR